MDGVQHNPSESWRKRTVGITLNPFINAHVSVIQTMGEPRAELAEWIDTARQVESADVPVPPNLIRSLMAKSVVDNWPRYEIADDQNGDPMVLRFGSPSAANKALEMLAKDSGMLKDHMDVSGSIEVKIIGVDVEDLR